ncbi:MAG: tRNA (N(6)-L-threonylcarbamoyladenosine(37)-C(2))-methylthiotransferase MtaB [Lachnospiraceae bacterium]|nr:tRNA (N(6)-L-threonylcarbamoyladenosine(37)-C(2))-methylthiotransferase MtaB [Lachnospiraceae bacterium]
MRNLEGRKKAALHNLGCKANAYETEAMQQMLEQAGYEIVDFAEKADVYVINTCSVTNMADRKSRQMLHRAKKQNPKSIVVAAGCYVQTKAEEVKLDASVDILIGNNKKQELITALEAYEKGMYTEDSCLTEINHRQPYENLSITGTAEHTRAFIKVQDGCNQFCSYCIIPYARGRVRSRAFSDVLSEVRLLARKGYQEIVLSGIHLSSYGTDIGETLLHLIKETARIDGIRRIRLGSLEPGIVTKEFAESLSGIAKICPHFHLSLQSGCDATLERMNRTYTTEEYRQSCKWLRQYFSHPAITTDVITGFPGETEEEFAATKEFLREIHFYEMHIFKYSKREGTKAAVMKEQVAEQVKAARSAELISLAHDMSLEFREYYVGTRKEVLMEEALEVDGRRYMVGYTKEYVRAALKTEDDLANTFAEGTITGRLADDLFLLGS